MRATFNATLLCGCFLLSSCQSLVSSSSLNEDTDVTPIASIEPVTTPTPSGYLGYAAHTTGVNGGQNGQTVIVTTADQLKTAAASYDPLIIKVSGILDGQNTQISVNSNKSIIGLPGAELHGLGLYMFGVSNIIIQNIKMYAGDASANDAAGFSAWSVKDSSHHVWIDHCDMYASPNDSAVLTHSLGSVTNGADYVTISWSTFHDQYLGILIGSSETQSTDANFLHVTIHHSLFQNVGERQPKLLWGHVHVFNNYYKDAKNDGHTPVGITATMGGTIRTDNNYFSNFNGPAITTVYDTLAVGYVSGLETNYKDSVGEFNLTTEESTWVPPYPYASFLTPVMNVPVVVSTGAGAILEP